MLGNPEPLPKFMNSYEMENYCKPIMEMLWDATKSDDLITFAAQTVDAAAGSNFDRDNIRTEPTTKNVIAKCQQIIEATKAAKN
jgi:hypothetical protein